MAAPSMDTVYEQANVLKAIPGTAISYWPAWFTFSIVEYVEGVIIQVVPDVGGPVGMLVNAGLKGMTRVVQMVTWDLVRNGAASGGRKTA